MFHTFLNKSIILSSDCIGFHFRGLFNLILAWKWLGLKKTWCFHFSLNSLHTYHPGIWIIRDYPSWPLSLIYDRLVISPYHIAINEGKVSHMNFMLGWAMHKVFNLKSPFSFIYLSWRKPGTQNWKYITKHIMWPKCLSH